MPEDVSCLLQLLVDPVHLSVNALWILHVKELLKVFDHSKQSLGTGSLQSETWPRTENVSSSWVNT